MAAGEQKRADRMETRIVQHHGFGSDTQSFRSAHQAAAVPTTNVDIRNIMSTLRDSKAHALNVQFGISEGNVYEERLVSVPLANIVRAVN